MFRATRGIVKWVRFHFRPCEQLQRGWQPDYLFYAWTQPVKNEPPDADGLRTLLATILAGVTDTKPTKWTKLIGDVEILPIVFNPRCNWSVSPSGTPAERDAIGKTVELVRAEHPYILGKPQPRDVP